MATVVLLRGVNLGPANRIAMPALRAALSDDGFGSVRSYLQSGNLVLDSASEEAVVCDRVRRLIAERFGLALEVLARDPAELARVVAANPFPELAERDPKRFQVSFLSGAATPGTEATLTSLAAPAERVAVGAREIYTWHAEGVARSKLWAKLGTRGGLGPDLTVTSRNWTTVTALLAMATDTAA